MTTAQRNTRLAMAIALVLGGAAMAPRHAAAAEEAAAQSTGGGLEEIIVTARKRAENLQDLGTSISAMSSADLERRFDVDLQSMSNAAPNVVIDDLQQGPGSPAAISIRGIGTTDVEKSFDPTTGVVVDGVFIGVNSGAMIKAIDLQSVEILRGPQGTLFGRNSIAGVINITRGKPSTDALGGAVRIGGGNYGDFAADGYVNIPLGDTLAFKFGAAKHQNDGWFHNDTLHKDVGALDYRSISPSIEWKPTDNLEFYYRYDQSWQDQDANTVVNMAQPNQVFCFYYDQCAKSRTEPQSGDRYRVLQNGNDPYQSYFNTKMHIGNASWKLNDQYTLEYVYGHFATDERVYQDWDGTPLTLYHTDRPATYDQRSNELRLTYKGERLSGTAGLYAWDSGYRIDLTSYIGFVDFLYGFPPGTVFTVKQTVRQNTKSRAAFFEGDYKFTDAWTLTLGGRYTKDDKESGLIDPLMPELAQKGSLDNPFKDSWSEFTPKLGVRYRVDDSLMYYFLYSKGFRAGGFSGRPGTYDAASTPYDPETVDNYEFGTKSEWLDGRLRLNASVFWMNYKNKQEEESVPTNQGTGQQTLVLNASEAEIKGLEVDLAAKITDGLSVTGNLGLLDAKYKKLIDPITGKDLSGLDLRRAPPVTFTLSPTYEWNALGGSFWVQADYRYIGAEELTFLNSPQSHNSAQNVLDASFNYKIGETTISLWGLNLTNEDAWSQAYDVGTSVTFPGLWTYAAPRPPRTWGVRLMQKF